MRVLYHYPPVHDEVYAVGVREIAILVSHLRAVAAGYSLRCSHFLVLEEDAELGLLLASRHDWLQSVLATLPHNWQVLQCAVIAEVPWIRHLHKRLSSARRPYVARHSLRGLSWPFSPPRVVWPNLSWVKPYWSAAAYVVSRRGAESLLQRYWPEVRGGVLHLGAVGEPHQAAVLTSGAANKATVTVDTTSQLWPAADQLLFNISATFMSAPLLTQPVEGVHVEHASFKKSSRDFVLDNWLSNWRGIGGTAEVMASVFVVGNDFAGKASESKCSRLVLGRRPARDASRGGAFPIWMQCRRLTGLPAHTRVHPALSGLEQSVAAAETLAFRLASRGFHPKAKLQGRQTHLADGFPPFSIIASQNASTDETVVTLRVQRALALAPRLSSKFGVVFTEPVLMRRYSHGMLTELDARAAATLPHLEKYSSSCRKLSLAARSSLHSSSATAAEEGAVNAKLKLVKLEPGVSCCVVRDLEEICPVCIQSAPTILVRTSTIEVLLAAIRIKATSNSTYRPSVWSQDCLMSGQSLLAISNHHGVFAHLHL